MGSFHQSTSLMKKEMAQQLCFRLNGKLAISEGY